MQRARRARPHSGKALRKGNFPDSPWSKHTSQPLTNVRALPEQNQSWHPRVHRFSPCNVSASKKGLRNPFLLCTENHNMRSHKEPTGNSTNSRTVLEAKDTTHRGSQLSSKQDMQAETKCEIQISSAKHHHFYAINSRTHQVQDERGWCKSQQSFAVT